eukprot:6212244-Pleurochrysis_carterae.AAC.12
MLGPVLATAYASPSCALAVHFGEMCNGHGTARGTRGSYADTVYWFACSVFLQCHTAAAYALDQQLDRQKLKGQVSLCRDQEPQLATVDPPLAQVTDSVRARIELVLEELKELHRRQ